jgi:peptidoglycan/xylan/chitin deacetylase (PgdA/CDA1 family)
MTGLPAVLAYHKVGTAELGGTWCTRGQLRRHLQALAQAGIRAVDLAAFAERLDGLASPVPLGLTVLLTFDDAFAGFAEHAWPELQAARVPAALFVVTDFVGRRATWDWPLPGRRVAHLDWQALRDLAAGGVTLGVHGATHRDLRRLDDAALAREVRASRARLEDRLGTGVHAIAYPFGRCDARVEHAVEAAGYRVGFVMAAPPLALPRRFAVPRHGVYIIDGARAVLDKVDDRRRGHAWQVRLERGIGACAELVARLPAHTAG